MTAYVWVISGYASFEVYIRLSCYSWHPLGFYSDSHLIILLMFASSFRSSRITRDRNVVRSGGSRNGAIVGGGGAVGWRGAAEGGGPASKGVWGSAASSPLGASGGALEAFTFFTSNPAENQCIRSAVNV